MCTTCGCGNPHSHTHLDENGNIVTHTHEHAHHHDHDHEHDHEHHGDAPSRKVTVQENILSRNNSIACRIRTYFEKNHILALNFVSSPGSGKTELLCATVRSKPEGAQICVIEGDQQTDNDANRIRETGAQAIQINTGKGCHLDAQQVELAVATIKPAPDSYVLIENVGNLVCPAEFDLGEAHKVVVISVTEGDDKPLKYPDMFAAADLMIINKVDLLPYVKFDCDRCEAYARRVNPKLRAIRMSAVTGEGIERWWAWLKASRMIAEL